MKKIIALLFLVLVIPTICLCKECNEKIFKIHTPKNNLEFPLDSKCRCGKQYPFYNEDNHLVGAVCIYEDGTEIYYSDVEKDIISYIKKISKNTLEKYDMTFKKTSTYKIINDNLTHVYDLKGNLIGKIITKDNKKFYYDNKENLIASGDKNKIIKATFCEYGGTPKPIYNSFDRRAYTICDDNKKRTLYTRSGKFSVMFLPTDKENTRKMINVNSKLDGYAVKEGKNTEIWYDDKNYFMTGFKFKESVVVVLNIDRKPIGYLRYKK